MPLLFIWPFSCLTLLFGYLSLFRTRPPPNASLKHSLLRKLPIELIGYITTFLPPPDAASFTISCRFNLLILGNQYLDRLGAEGHKLDRIAFLTLLERDLPFYIMCHHCGLLHRGTESRHRKMRLPLSHTRPLCATADWKNSVNTYICNGFDSITFQSAMKLYRCGYIADCNRLLCLLCGLHTHFKAGLTYQQVVDYRIVNGHLLLRRQDWLLYAARQQVRFPTQLYLAICPHISHHRGRNIDTNLGIKIACRISHINDLRLNSSCSTGASVQQCARCPTDFQVDTKDFGKNGTALILTLWLNLGEGRTPLEPWWDSHVFHGQWRYQQAVRTNKALMPRNC